MKKNKTVFPGKGSTPRTTDDPGNTPDIINITPSKFGRIEPSTVYTNDVQCHLCHRTYLSKETRDKHLVTFHRIGATGEPELLSGKRLFYQE